MSSLKVLMSNYAQTSANASQSRKPAEENNNDASRKRPKHEQSVEETYHGPPHFLIIGAQKSGTMAAVKNLNKHPQVSCLSEVHYFDLGWHSKTKAEYRAMFKGPKLMLGEKTPELIYVDECLIRMKGVLAPSTKFLFFIRDPIKRAYSGWNMNRSKDREQRPFDDCIDANLTNLDEYRSYGTAEYHLVQRGFYQDQIERFLRVFPDPSKLLIVVAEHIKKDPQSQYQRIFDFLGVSRPDGVSMPELVYEDDHIGQYVPGATMPKSVADKLRKVYQPHNERLFRWLGYRIPEWEQKDTTAGGRSGSGSSGSSSGIVVGVADSAIVGTAASANASAAGIITTSSSLSRSSSSSQIPSSSCWFVHNEYEAATTSSSISNHNSSTPSSSSSSSSSSAMSVSTSMSLVFPPTSITTGDFARLGQKADTDKITHHGYQRFYPRYLESYRALTGCAILEIGIDQSKSLALWLEYFPHAFIYGIDIGEAAVCKGERHQVFQADQSDRKQLQRVIDTIEKPIFAIIDDGSHIPQHQVSTFDLLFQQVLLPGGTYIIEDIETSYWTKNGLYGYTTRYGYHHEHSCVEVFKDLLDDVNREFLSRDAREAQERRIGRDISIETRNAVSSVTFGQNCIIIVKKTEEETQAFNHRHYRYAQNL